MHFLQTASIKKILWNHQAETFIPGASFRAFSQDDNDDDDDDDDEDVDDEDVCVYISFYVYA